MAPYSSPVETPLHINVGPMFHSNTNLQPAAVTYLLYVVILAFVAIRMCKDRNGFD